MRASPPRMVATLDSVMARCEPFGECLIYEGVKAGKARIVRTEGRYVMARRFVYESTTGEPIAPGAITVMRCREGSCLNFEHIGLFTRLQLSLLLAKEGVYSTPSARAAITRGNRKKSGVKLTPALAAEIRRSPDSGTVLGKRYRIHPSMANRIKAGKAWREGVANNSVFNQAA